jgi:hypothetical protein
MRNLLRALTVACILIAAGAARAGGEQTARLGETEVKKGEKVHVCGCGQGCTCGSIQAGPGTCACHKPLVAATVLEVRGGRIHVGRGGKPGQTSFPIP